MSESLDPQEALRRLRGVTSLEDPATVAARRPALVALPEREIRSAPRRQRVARGVRAAWFAGAAIAALASLAWLSSAWAPASPVDSLARHGGSAPPSPAPLQVPTKAPSSAAEPPLLQGTSLGVGSEVRTDERGRSRLALGERVRVEVGERSGLKLLRLDDAEHVVRLARGSVDVEVAQGRGSPRAFAVETPDSRVEVRGTGFRVEVHFSEAGQPYSVVTVRHGRVAVTHQGKQRLLEAGMTFRSEPRTPASGAESATATASTTLEGTEPSAQSTLAAQNRLFERALAARDRGDDRAAVRLFEELCQRYPSSPLFGAARAEIERARSRGQP